MTLDSTAPQSLRYVPARSVESPAVDFAELPVETPDRRTLGHLMGVVIDLVAHRLRYMVVEPSRREGGVQRLVPFSGARIDNGRRSLRLENDTPLETCPEFDPRRIRALAHDDLVVAV
jgi:hypothetical protein